MENEDEETGNWQVMRQDTHGVIYIIKSGLSEKFAEALLRTYKGNHHQDWWKEETKPGVNDHYPHQ
ncbi:MAG: hypothetical protein GC204_09410 [Chloroflexi bacterium]|nr:hypothetical protein [Chloroflexota bacterium]